MSIKNIAKIGKEIWRALADKSEWEEKAAEDKKRYEIEYKKWFEDGGEAAIKANKKEAKAAKKGAAGGNYIKIKDTKAQFPSVIGWRKKKYQL